MRHALITGAGSGLAAGIAERLARAGNAVSITVRPGGTPAEATLQRVRRYDAEAIALEAAGEDAGSLLQAARDARSARGQIDILVHGIGPMTINRFAKTTLADARAMFETNAMSAMAAAAAVLPDMRDAGFGRLIFFGMTGSSITRPSRSLSLYGAAKAAVVAFAKSLALEEAAHGITVNVIEPGDIRNKTLSRAEAMSIPAKNPSGHAGSWEDVADAVCFCVADDSTFINGAVIAVGGGLIDANE